MIISVLGGAALVFGTFLAAICCELMLPIREALQQKNKNWSAKYMIIKDKYTKDCNVVVSGQRDGADMFAARLFRSEVYFACGLAANSGFVGLEVRHVA